MKLLETLYIRDAITGKLQMYRIQKLNRQDVEACEGELLFLQNQGFGTIDEQMFSEKMEKGLTDEVIVVKHCTQGKNRIVGYINNAKFPRDDWFDHYIFGHSTIIDNLVVEEGHRNRGLAKKLMTYMLLDCKDPKSKYGFLQLYVRNNNVQAYTLYKHMGFKKFCLDGLNSNFSIMLYQQDKELDFLGSLCAAAIVENEKNAKSNIGIWFSKFRKNKFVKASHFVSAQSVMQYFEKDNNMELFNLCPMIIEDYYCERDKMLAQYKKYGINHERYPFEQYVVQRVNEYYSAGGKACNTLNDIVRKNSLKVPLFNHGPEVIQILKSTMVSLRHAQMEYKDTSAISHYLTVDDVQANNELENMIATM